jgi:cysteine desulfurase family protein (TIGR01976 family)
MSQPTLDIDGVRRRFSSLNQGFAFFDAPGGTQVPDEVGEAMAKALRDASANMYAPYATSHRVHAIVDEAESRSAAFLGCTPEEVTFGSNMTTLNYVLTHTASRDWAAGDEILVSDLDHDGNVAPWLDVARDRGLVVKHIAVRPDTLLDLDDLRAKLSDRTRVVAFSWASNAVGTIAQAAEVVAIAHEAGALAWIDAVHYAAHEAVDVVALDADVLLCSAYKWCGPHLGLGYVRASVSEAWTPYKTRPSSVTPVGRSLATGTLPYEMLAGLNATFAYLDDIGGLAAIRTYERELGQRFVDGFPDGVELYGPQTMEGRVPTFALNLRGRSPEEVARHLGDRGIFVWHGDYYAIEVMKRLGLPNGAVRVGIVHYNTADEVDRLLAELASLA